MVKSGVDVQIVADENIPHVAQIFAAIGKVTLVNGRKLTKEQLLTTDILLVRSVTPVNAALLDGTPIKLVASATTGIDHLDTHYLDEQGIAYCHAPGANAQSVVDYVISALCALEGVMYGLLQGATVGIVGFGQVGSSLYRRLRQLDIPCAVYDPLLEPATVPDRASLKQVLGSDVVCLHTPLSTQGDYPSYHLLNKTTLSWLKPEAVLVSAGRGAVVDNEALLQLLKQSPNIKAVLDVWENEPHINAELLTYVRLATPHIAGYSYDGKLAGTIMIFERCCQLLKQKYVTNESFIEEIQVITVPENATPIEGVLKAVKASYDITKDDERLRSAVKKQTALLGKTFDEQRKNYPKRRELSCFSIKKASKLNIKLQHYLLGLGFKLEG